MTKSTETRGTITIIKDPTQAVAPNGQHYVFTPPVKPPYVCWVDGKTAKSLLSQGVAVKGDATKSK
jgi:hypothetical protein